MAHKIAQNKPAKEWRYGFPLGNGVLGAMFWGDGRPLCFTLDHSGLWDLRGSWNFRQNPDYNYASLRRLVAENRFDEAREIFETAEHRENPVTPTKIYLGRLEFDLGKTGDWKSVFNLDSAVVTAEMAAAGQKCRLSAFVHRQKNILCLRVARRAKTSPPKFIPMDRLNKAAARTGYPAPEFKETGGFQIITQQIPEGPVYAVGWNKRGPEFFIAAEIAESVEAAYLKVKTGLEEALAEGFNRLYRQHVSEWRKFWSVSKVSLPEKTMEFFWYYGVYILASSARRKAIPPGLQGVWAMDGLPAAWRGDYHTDMNIQETFWPACASGHLDLLDCWCDFLQENIPAAQEFTRRFFQTEGTFWLCATVPGYRSVPGWYTVQFAWSNTGWLAWMVWLRWRYSLDLEWLRETGYPVLSEMFKFYRANLAAEPDGYLHVPLSTSPEYRENLPAAWAKDPNMDLALIRRCCDWLVEMEAALKKDDLSPAAREIREKLAPYALTSKKELCLWPGKPLDESHRHPSHLMAIHPAMDLTIDGGPDEVAIINASVEQFLFLGQYMWGGHTYGQMVSFAAVLGRSGWAYDSLKKLIEYWIAPNGLYFNRDFRDSGLFHFKEKPGELSPFTIEPNCGISAGISDMLVQGWGDKIRVFPAVPPHWRDAAFEDLRVEGAFRVSAVRKGGETIQVKVTAGAERTMRLLDPFAGRKVKTGGAKIRKEGDLFLAELKAGQSITFSVDQNSVKPVSRQSLPPEVAVFHI